MFNWNDLKTEKSSSILGWRSDLPGGNQIRSPVRRRLLEQFRGKWMALRHLFYLLTTQAFCTCSELNGVLLGADDDELGHRCRRLVPAAHDETGGKAGCTKLRAFSAVWKASEYYRSWMLDLKFSSLKLLPWPFYETINRFCWYFFLVLLHFLDLDVNDIYNYMQKY